MSDTIIVAIVSLLGTAVGSFSGIRLITYRIEQLEKKVEKHNNLVERTYNLESKCGIYDEKFKVVNNRVNDLECEK